ncbi:MAG: metallophosphoesterase family protein [Capsulimonadaceae bacterium]
MTVVRLLLFSDLHCSREAAEALVVRAADVDVVIGAGDFAQARRNIGTCIEILRKIERPSILVPGNNESLEELRHACRDWPSALVLHGTSAQIGPVTFFGIGGGIPVTPFGPWSWDFSEHHAAEMLSNCPPSCVLISHSPPKGAVDTSGSGQSNGSTAVRDAVLETHPLLVVCGHIHACGGKQAVLGSTPVVNAGPDGVLWSVTC